MVTIGEGIRDADGRIVQVRGYLIDVTDSLHRDVAAATRLAVELSAATRAAIEQAKGALMITYGIDENEAFALLRQHSQHSNIKIRDIATGITDRTNDPDLTGLTAAGKITEILADLTNPASPAPDDTKKRATPATPGRWNGETPSAESGERLSA